MKTFGMHDGRSRSQSRDKAPAPAVPPERKPSEFTRFVVADLEGNTFEVTTEDFGRCPVFSGSNPAYARLKPFVANELAQRPADGAVPKHIEYMRRHELVDYCDVSEKGHYRWYPKGVLIQRLILDYAAQLAYDWGAFETYEETYRPSGPRGLRSPESRPERSCCFRRPCPAPTRPVRPNHAGFRAPCIPREGHER